MSLSKLWLNYDLAEDAQASIKIITDDGRECIKENVLKKGINITQDVLIPNDMQYANSYTFEIYGYGDIRIKAMERIDRTATR